MRDPVGRLAGHGGAQDSCRSSHGVSISGSVDQDSWS